MTGAQHVSERSWTLDEAERWLLGLELFGMKFGLERMELLMSELGSPQRGFRSIHVAGSNGKSSTTRMIAAILERHGITTGEYLSPHLVSFTERVRTSGRDIDGDAFARAALLVREAAATVDASLTGDERVTQFEALTATGYLALQQAGVELAVIEAGLGGRYDATNVIPSEVQVLTTVGLEHTRWLGDTIEQIAAEKTDIVRPGGTLVVGAGLAPDALAVAQRVCAQRGARLVVAPAPSPQDLPAAALGPFQRINFALARAAAAELLGDLDEDAVAVAAAQTTVPGRFEIVADDPLTIHDGAHNPDGITALTGALRELLAGRGLVCCLSVLDDKDAEAMLRGLLPLCEQVVLTTCSHPRAVPAAQLLALCERIAGPQAVVVEGPKGALERARELAGPGGVALATGSLYLIADLRRPSGVTGRSIL